MSATSDSQAPAFTPGLKFPEWDCVITPAQQAEKLACCGIDPALYGDRVDITQLAYAAVMSALRAGISINGRVHMSQYFDLRRPVLLGETLRVRGEVVAVTPDRRGAIEESRFDFVRPDGSIPLSTRRASLVLDPKVGAERKSPGMAPPPVPDDPRAGLTLIARHRLVPEKVAAYSIEADNLIHSDPETARRFGFRAPVAAGLMAVHFMMAALRQPGPIERLRATVRFRRPMFWDEALEVWGRRAAGGNGPMTALAVINGEGKVANDCQVDEIGYGAGT
jgi:acyl dehydratase